MRFDIHREIEEAIGVGVTSAAPLAVGFGLDGLRATLSDGRKIAVKRSGAKYQGQLATEGYMLRRLAELSRFPVPEVYHAGPDLLIMSWIDNDSGSPTAPAQRHAAELVADLHARRFDYFGFERHTLIGPLEQPNPRSETWLPFFRDQRLLRMARSAAEENRLPQSLFSRLQKLAEHLDRFLLEPEHPSLVHGDLWTGNILVKRNRIAGFVDPAIYFADREIELAFTTMFGTFGQPFFDAYQGILPLEPGFQEIRRHIYNLYPTLVHVRLFGAGYLAPIEQTLARLGF